MTRGGRPMAAVLALFAAGSAATCQPSDLGQPDQNVPPLPDGLLAFLEADTTSAQRVVEDGVFYYDVRTEKGPWAVHLVSADLARCELELLVVPAVDEDADRQRMTVTEMTPNGTVVPLAGVNGDFFMENGLPLGPEVTLEAPRRVSSRPALSWSARRVPWIGSPSREAGVMVLGPDTVGPAAAVAQQADSAAQAGSASQTARPVQVMGGYPELLAEGARVSDLENSFAADRHPRTAVGYDSDVGRLWLVVVDGRRSASVGMTLPELTDLLLSAGADEALNLDGGGSSTIWVGEIGVANSPSDSSGERPVGNSLWLVRDGRSCPNEDG